MYGTSSYGSVEYAGELSAGVAPGGIQLSESAHINPSFFKGASLRTFLEHVHLHSIVTPIKVYLVDLFDSISVAVTDFIVGHIYHVNVFDSFHLLASIQKTIYKTFLDSISVNDDKRQTDMIYFIRYHLNVFHPRGRERPIQALGKGDPNSF